MKFLRKFIGTGNLKVLALLRKLRSRTGNDFTYGHYLALQMSIGLLFLGGGLIT
jgi:hypothetical protein